MLRSTTTRSEVPLTCASRSYKQLPIARTEGKLVTENSRLCKASFCASFIEHHNSSTCKSSLSLQSLSPSALIEPFRFRIPLPGQIFTTGASRTTHIISNPFWLSRHPFSFCSLSSNPYPIRLRGSIPLLVIVRPTPTAASSPSHASTAYHSALKGCQDRTNT